MGLELKCGLHSASEVTMPVLSIVVSQSLVPAQHVVGLVNTRGMDSMYWLLTPLFQF